MKFSLSIIISLMFICSSVSTVAQNKLPYEQEGMIYNINLETGQFNVGDMIFTVPSDTVIHKPSGSKFVGLELLKPNTSIGYTMKNNVITEIWILERDPVDPTVNDD